MAEAVRKYNLKPNEARAFVRHLRVSPQKLNLVAGLIRGLKVDKALEALMFCKKRIAKEVRKTVLSAMANAEANHGLDIDKLYVKEAYVGKSIVMKRGRARARGRFVRIFKPFSNLTVVLAEQEGEVGKKAKKAKKAEPKQGKKAEKETNKKEEAK